MCQLVIVIVMITIYAISNSVVMITVAHVITTTLVHKQSVLSDVYSYGRIMLSINEKLVSSAVSSMANLCLEYNAGDRPKTNELCTFVENFLS